ncbi:MAG: hypothetical protein ACJARE_002428 [Paracoccaceae bacterium]
MVKIVATTDPHAPAKPDIAKALAADTHNLTRVKICPDQATDAFCPHKRYGPTEAGPYLFCTG